MGQRDKISLICLEGKSMTPHRGNTVLFCSFQQFPRLRLGPSKGLLSWHGALLGPSNALCNAPGTTEIQGHPQVCSPWCVGPDHRKRLTQTLIVSILKMHFFLLFQKLETPGPPLTPPPLQPPWYHTTSGQHNHKKLGHETIFGKIPTKEKWTWEN